MFLQKLSAKIIGILIVFFLVALIAIGFTLFLSWQLEGNAAAINDAGSQRMRTYRIVFLLSRQIATAEEEAALQTAIRKEVATFEKVMHDLEQGDPKRPLFLPKEEEINRLLRQMRKEWNEEMRPRIEMMLSLPHEQRAAQRVKYRDFVEQFVAHVNQLVAAVEVSGTRSATWLRLLQIGLIVLAMIGTTLLIAFFFVMVIRPLEEMRDGIRRMSEADFRVRLRVRRNDEFGELGAGFNAMADRLEDIYDKLEQRVEEKTRDIENKHRELTLLYEVAAYLSVPVPRDEACYAVLDKVMLLLDAQAGLVRFVESGSSLMHIGVHRNLSESFLRSEGSLPVGSCLCSGAAVDGQTVSSCPNGQPLQQALLCRDREGYASMVAIPISSKSQILGVFNLFFYSSRTLTGNEVRLLEAVGQHLGVAIDNQRLVEREKELAVSEERNLLAEELHDSIAQSLAFLNIEAQMLQDSLRRNDLTGAQDELARIREGIQESYDDVRELLVHFRTRLEAGNVETAIASALEKFEGQTGIMTTLERSGEHGEIPTQNAIQILHIVQEALSNVRKHAQARHVRVSIERSAQQCVICVKDDGRGFEVGVEPDDGVIHVGLNIMRERAHRIGGQFKIESTPGQGSIVTLTLPRETSPHP
jgi:two-component system nitrate/nitrite sensor histidine kinase NarX